MILNYKGIPVFYSDQGEGKVVLLLHGFLENHTMWEPLQSHLIKQSYRVITIDLLGHGQTKCLGYIHTMEDMAAQVMSVLRELKVETFTLIGHSMGGYVALALADQYPKLIDGLCLMNSTTLADNLERIKNRNRAIAAVKKNHKTFVAVSITNLFAPYNRERFSKEIERVKQEALKTPLQGIIAALEGMKIRPNRQYILQNKTFKIMMIVGRKDPVLEYDTLINQTESTSVEIVEFPDGHMSHIENIEDFTYNIFHFIEK